jgi:hypothetical protein
MTRKTTHHHQYHLRKHTQSLVFCDVYIHEGWRDGGQAVIWHKPANMADKQHTHTHSGHLAERSMDKTDMALLGKTNDHRAKSGI